MVPYLFCDAESISDVKLRCFSNRFSLHTVLLSGNTGSDKYSDNLVRVNL